MKINIKVRLKNRVFWVTFLPSLVTFVYATLGCFGISPTIAEDTISQFLLTAVSALATFGVLVDPTTKGVNDSERAMTYTEPN